MKLRMAKEIKRGLAATAPVAVGRPSEAELCRRAWRQGRRLEASLPDTFGVVLTQFAQTATREGSEVMEVLFPADLDLERWASRFQPLELAALVAYYLQVVGTVPPPPPFVPDPAELVELTLAYEPPTWEERIARHLDRTPQETT